MRAKFVNEIGEATVKPVPFEYIGEFGKTDKQFGDKGYEYTFETLNEKYIGLFIIREKFTEYHFYAEGKKTDAIINRGDLYTVMSTNIEIIKDFLSKRETKKLLIFSGEGKGNKRSNLYLKFVEKNIPDNYEYKILKNHEGIWGILLDKKELENF